MPQSTDNKLNANSAATRAIGRGIWGLRIGMYVGTAVILPLRNVLFADNSASDPSSNAGGSASEDVSRSADNSTSDSSSHANSSASEDVSHGLSHSQKVFAGIHGVAFVFGAVGYISGVLNCPSEQTVSKLQTVGEKVIKNATLSNGMMYLYNTCISDGVTYLYNTCQSLTARQNASASSHRDESVSIIGSINGDVEGDYGSIPDIRNSNRNDSWITRVCR